MNAVTSRENKWLKAFRAALQGTGPGQGEPIGVEGPKVISEMCRSGLKPEVLLLTESGAAGMEAAIAEIGVPGTRILLTTDKFFAWASGTSAPQGVAALYRQPHWQFEDVLRGKPDSDGRFRADASLIAVLAGIQDPGNVGTILRSAEALGATGAVAIRGTADPWSSKAVRASAGSALRFPILRGIPAPVLLAQFRMAKIMIVATSARAAESNASRAMPREGYTEPLAIWVGSEGAGLPVEIEREADAVISLPMAAEVESLNAGVAASIVLHEVASRRRQAECEPRNHCGTVSSR